MNEKRFLVFVSSPTDDLVEERDKVTRSLMLNNFFVSIMEYPDTNPVDQSQFAEKLIDQCDYYVLIVGGLYGALHSSGTGFIEREFDHAVRQRKPIFAMLRKNIEDLPEKKREKDLHRIEMHEAFLRRLQGGSSVGFWTSPDDVPSKVVFWLTRMTKVSPGVGWLRGDQQAEMEDELRKITGERDRLLDRLKAYAEPKSQYMSYLKKSVKVLYRENNRTGSLSLRLGDILRPCLPVFDSAISYQRGKMHLNEVLSSFVRKGSYYTWPVAIEEESLATIWTFLKIYGFIKPTYEGSDYYVAEERADIAVKRWSDTPWLFR